MIERALSRRPMMFNKLERASSLPGGDTKEGPREAGRRTS